MIDMEWKEINEEAISIATKLKARINKEVLVDKVKQRYTGKPIYYFEVIDVNDNVVDLHFTQYHRTKEGYIKDFNRIFRRLLDRDTKGGLLLKNKKSELKNNSLINRRINQ